MSMTATESTNQNATVSCPICGTLNRVAMDKIDAGPKCGSCSRPLLFDRPIKVTDEDFDQVVKGTTVPVIVDFYADWCGPCKMMAPIFDQLAAEWKGRVLVAKLDTDQSPRASMAFNVRGIPTMIVFKDGKEVARQVGAVPKQRIEQLLSV